MNFGVWRPTEGPSLQAEPPEAAAVTMTGATYMLFHRLHDAHSNLVASEHLAGLASASDSACKTLHDQAALYDAEMSMYHNRLCENLS